MTYGNFFQLTQNVHHSEAVVESKSNEEAAQTELPKASGESCSNTCDGWTMTVKLSIIK